MVWNTSKPAGMKLRLLFLCINKYSTAFSFTMLIRPLTEYTMLSSYKIRYMDVIGVMVITGVVTNSDWKPQT